MVSVGNIYNSEYLSNFQYAKAWFLRCTEDNRIIGKKITEEEFEELKETYSRYTPDWIKELESKDHTEYEIYGDDYSLNNHAVGKKVANRVPNSPKVQAGYENAQIKSGDAKIEAQKGNAAGATVGAGLATGAAVGSVASTSIAMSGDSLSAFKAGEALWMVGAALSFATGVLYEATRPNKEANQCLLELDKILKTDQSTMQNSSTRVKDLGMIVSDTVVQTSLEQESMQEELAKKQELYEKALAIYQEIGARVKAGEKLTPQEEAQYKASGKQIEVLGEQVEYLKNEFLDAKANNANLIASQQSNFDQEANSIASTQGHAAYAHDLDSKTKTLVALQIAAQSANATSGAISASIGVAEAASTDWFFGVTAWMWIFVGLGYAGAGMSTHGIVEQAGFLKNTNNEINTRTQTQNTTNQTLVDYAANMDLYAISNDDINDIELETSDVDSWSDFEFEDLSSLTDNGGTDLNTIFTGQDNTTGSTTPDNTTDTGNDSQKKNNPFITS